MEITKVFKNYLLKYLLGFGVVFITNIVMLHVAEETIESYIVKQIEIQVKDGIQRMDETIEKMDLISQMMYQNSDFTKLIYNGATFPKEQIIALRNSNDLIKNVRYVSDCTPYMFVLFKNNDIFLSSSQCTTSFSDYYDKFLRVAISGQDIMDSVEFKRFIFDNKNSGTQFLKLDFINYVSEGNEEKLKDALLYLSDGNIRLPSQKYGFCFLISREYLVDTILGDNYDEQDCFLVIKDGELDEELLCYGNVPETVNSNEEELGKGKRIYHTIESGSKHLKWQVITGVSSGYIARQMAAVQRLLAMYLCVGFLICVLLALYFSLGRYYGFRKVWLSLPLEERGRVKQKGFDEYQYISDHVTELDGERKGYREQLDDLKRQNQAIILENMITKGICSERERHLFVEYFGKEPEFYCVVVVNFGQTDTGGTETITVNMTELLKRKKILVIGSVHSGVTDELFIIECLPNQSTSMIELLKVFEDTATEICDKYNCTLHIGISAVGTGINNINKCYEQAKRIVQSQYEYENENIVRLYDITENTLYENPITIEFMSRLYSMLISAQYENVKKELQQIERRYNRAPYLYEMHKEQIFWAIRNVFHTVVLHLNNVEKEKILPKYDPTMKCSDMILMFQHSAKGISNYVHHMKKSKNDVLKEKIKQYIEEHYQDAGLSAFIVSREVGIAEKYLYQYWKEQTGETFAVYLLRIRIDKAKEYLEQTDYNNEQIAALTGFASTNTFYRNFQKVVGVTPKKYKENIILKEFE